MNPLLELPEVRWPARRSMGVNSWRVDAVSFRTVIINTRLVSREPPSGFIRVSNPDVVATFSSLSLFLSNHYFS